MTLTELDNRARRFEGMNDDHYEHLKTTHRDGRPSITVIETESGPHFSLRLNAYKLTDTGLHDLEEMIRTHWENRDNTLSEEQDRIIHAASTDAMLGPVDLDTAVTAANETCKLVFENPNDESDTSVDSEHLTPTDNEQKEEKVKEFLRKAI